MEEEILFEHQIVQLSYHATGNYLHLKWKGVVQLEVYKKALILCLNFMEEKKLTKFLVDQSDLEYVGSEAQAWLSMYWFPEAEKIAKENLYFAIISSKKIFVNLASKFIAQRLKSKTMFSITHYFEEEKEAILWLNNPQFTEN